MDHLKSVSHHHLSMLESFPYATVIIDANGEIHYANDQVRALFGYVPNDLVGRTLETLIPRKFGKSQINNLIGAIRENQPTDSMNMKPIVLQGNHIEDKEFPVTMKISSLPIEFGDLVAVVISDESRKVSIENELIRKNHLLNFAEEIVGMGHWQWDLLTNDVIWSDNLYKVFGRSEVGGLKYDTYFSYVHPDDMEYVTERVQTSIADRKFHHFFHKILLKDGQVKTIHLVGQIFTNDNDEVVEMIGTCQDVTENLKNEQLLRNASILEAKSMEMEQFVYIASHDLRHPLLTIVNYLKAFDEDFGHSLTDDAKEYLSSISQSAERMDKLIKGLLDYARLSQKKQLETVDCDEVVQNVIKDLSATIEKEQAKIITYPLPVIDGYEMEMHQLFQNIILNAIKFRKKKITPVIHIKSQKLEIGAGYLFEISDNGIGMPEKDLDKIFSIFRRLHENEEFEGYGLGLANCKKIVELHHGEIWAQSEIGIGSSFFFTINT
ncbi:ATP-binding protein [Marinoscillum sp.]|uniref:ATP-binding protein n=1 Tax=Marinoscillum sp. TaxID=2024838 RepID=UPI003BAB36F0